jgi:predicted permease
MSDLIFSFNIIMPIFILIFLGYFLKRIKLFSDDFLKVANDFTFKVLLPVLLFNNVFNSDIIHAFNIKLVACSVISVITIFLILLLIVPLFVKDKKRTSVLIQGIFRSNFILFGVPLSESMFGAQGGAIAAVVAAIYVPVINILSTLVLFIYSDAPDKSLKKVFMGVISNPLVLGGFLGIIASLLKGALNFELPYFASKALSDIKIVASPFAFIILGADLKFKSLLGNIKTVLIGTIGKLVIIPLTFLLISYFIGFSGLEFAVLIAIFATPNAVSSYAMAIKYRADSKLAGELVIASTIFSIVTMFAFIYLSRYLGII